MLGSDSAFSAIVLRKLLAGNANLCGFVMHAAPGPSFEPERRALPVVLGGSGAEVALANGIRLIHVTSMHDEAPLECMKELGVDVLLVACFPRILDPSWIGLADEVSLNLHPSLLPSYRGPTPLFWQFREGERESGVTLHVIEPAVDAGDIVAQQAVPIPLGARFSQLNAQLAEHGAALVLDVLARGEAGLSVPRTAQDETLASYQPFPREADFRFDTHFTAERAYRFMEGTREWGIPYEVDIGDAVFVLEHALRYRDDVRMATPFEVRGTEVRIRCSQGVLEATGRRAPVDVRPVDD